jgi:hypothetical protein
MAALQGRLEGFGGSPWDLCAAEREAYWTATWRLKELSDFHAAEAALRERLAHHLRRDRSRRGVAA